ncbi:MAG: PAS domain S-box protein [Ignavibacteriales bacterium]|nr:PAS domain S-box protein [Ignavibacteriales bacterium]
MRDEAKTKSLLIKELQDLRKKVSSQESTFNRHKSAAKKLQAQNETAEHYKLVSENSGDVIWLFNLEKEKFSYVSPSVKKLRGYTPEEIIEQTMKDALTNESFNFVSSLLPNRIKAFENGDDSARELISEVDQPHKDGHIIHTEVVTTLLKNNEGRVCQILGVTRDITERKKTDAALQKNEERFRRLFEEDLAANFISTVDGNLIMCNSAFVKMFKYNSIEEALKINCSDLYLDPADRIGFLQLLKTKRRIINNEIALRRHDGKMIHVIENVVGHFNENDELYEISGYMIDQTEPKRVEELVKLSEEKFNKSFHSSPIAMTIQSDDDLFMDVNDSFLKMIEYQREDIIGYRGHDLNLWADDNERENAQIKFQADGVIRNFEFSFRTKFGKIGTGIIWAEPILISGETCVLTTAFNITDRKRVEAALKESEEKYRNIYNQAPVGIYQSTVEGKMISANDRLVQILGYNSKNELMECDLEKDIYFNREDRIKSIFNYETHGRVADLDLCWKKKDGTPIWIQLTAQAIKDSSGSTLYYEGFVRDVSERIEAETKLRENQKLLSTVIETMPVGIWLIDRNGKIMHGNKAARMIWEGIKYVGIDDYGEYVGWFTNTGKRIEAREWGAARALTNGEIIINEEIEIECFNKEHKFIYHSAVPIRNSKKEITGVVVLNQDITEQKAKELQIRMLSSAVEQSTVSVFITDLKGHIQYVNRKFLESTGYSRKEVLGKNPSILKSGLTTKDEYRNMWETIAAGNEWRGELLNKTKDGKLFWELEIISSIRNNSGVITNYLAVKEDISNQKKLTEELIAAKEHAEHSDNLKTEFIAQMSHEIRTPLNILLSFSNFIKEELEDKKQITDELEEYFSKVNNAGTRIIRTIELILNMSEIQTGSYTNDPKPTDILNDILNHTYHKFHQLVDDEKLQFELIRNAVPTQSIIDHYSVEQIFNHLLENAIKFTDEGYIKIYVDKNELDKPVIKIEDSGIGIGEDYLKNLYSPFSQEDRGYSRSYEGNGLGLALVKKYCDLNKIQIDVQSKKGVGSVFTLVFP